MNISLDKKFCQIKFEFDTFGNLLNALKLFNNKAIKCNLYATQTIISNLWLRYLQQKGLNSKKKIFFLKSQRWYCDFGSITYIQVLYF